MKQNVIKSFRNEENEWYLENVQTGKVRKMSSHGYLLVDDSEIDMEAIKAGCAHGVYNAERKLIAYADVSLYDGLKDGFGAIVWMLYPDGRYFADSDGFGMEDNNEENVYAIIDANLEIIEPFRPIENVGEYLKKLRNAAQKEHEDVTTRIFNLIITDESGSMNSIKKEAIDSVNETLQTIAAAQQKYPGQEHFVTMVQFHTDVTTVCDCVPVAQVKELDENTYRPSCCTALYDAMGMSLNSLRRKVQEGDKVLVTVVTDGCENASREYNGNAIKALVDELKAAGWVFAYVGANHDVESFAASISITNTMHFHADSVGTRDMSRRMSSSRGRLFARIHKDDFNPEEANVSFFNED